MSLLDNDLQFQIIENWFRIGRMSLSDNDLQFCGIFTTQNILNYTCEDIRKRLTSATTV